MVMIDINKLKIINDLHGHPIGDTAIALVAMVLKGGFREHDHIFRYDGDEFLLLAFDFKEAEIRQRLNKVETVLYNSSIKNIIGFPLTISWGVDMTGPHNGFRDSLEQADKAMYQQKTTDANAKRPFQKF